ncbi:transporter [Klebsiella pneumoniae]|uniref:Transporter n=1 Tax=Klebsiella pneumoniae TaxID=573 RepID=A0A377TV95_KLEPN|nr:transporter [Klebsiella pneumoniae]
MGYKTQLTVRGWWVKNLLSVEGLHWFLPNVIKNFSGFAPLGAILALVLGAGFAERGGPVTGVDGQDGLARQRPLCQLYGAVYRLFSHISSDAALVIMRRWGR